MAGSQSQTQNFRLCATHHPRSNPLFKEPGIWSLLEFVGPYSIPQFFLHRLSCNDFAQRVFQSAQRLCQAFGEK